MKLALLIVVLALPLAAQTPKPAAVPTIPDAVVSRFWKAQSQVQQAESSLQNARAQMGAVVTQMGDACGKDFQAQMNTQGDPACVAKPAAKETKPNGK
jgi:hypothetical protein